MGTSKRFAWSIAFVAMLFLCVTLMTIPNLWANMLGALAMLAFVCLAVWMNLPEGDAGTGAFDPTATHASHHLYQSLLHDGGAVCTFCGAIAGTSRARAWCPSPRSRKARV